jgi:prophage antirepressor-like protein
MNQLTKMFEGNQLRIIEKDNEPWFVVKDICEILELSNPTKAVSRLDDDERSNLKLGRQGNANVVNEFGLYNLVLGSRKPEAKQFKRWITHDVIPSIRKNGAYTVNQPQSQLEVLQGTINQLVEQERRVSEVEKKLDNISNIMTMDSFEWRDKVNSVLKKIANKWSGVEPYRSVKKLSYERLEKRAGCKLELRLNNRKERALAQGMTKSYIRKINKLDVIQEDKKLIEIYIQIIKEMAIQHQVDASDLPMEIEA